MRAESVMSAVPDVLAPGLEIVFCGINPGRVSAAAQAPFAKPRNHFWAPLQPARLTPRLLGPAAPVPAAAPPHSANPAHDFWRLLHAARLTPRLLGPGEQFEALGYGIGITNAAPRTTPGYSDLRRADFAGARERLEQLAEELRPGWI